MELWRNILGYEGFYQVSNYGRVRSLDRIVNATLMLGNKKVEGAKKIHRGRILKPQKRGDYEIVMLSKQGKVKGFLVHRLVASAFPEICGEWFEGCVIDHGDDNPENNRADNLLVCTQSENNGKETHKRNVSKGKSIPITQYTTEGEFVNSWKSASVAAKQLGYTQAGIHAGLSGRNKAPYGYIWKYKE